MAQNFRLLFPGPESAQTLNVDRISGESFGKREVMLLRQQGGGYQQSHLLSLVNCFKGGPQSDFCLTIADITANQAVHGPWMLHVCYHIIDGFQLIRSLLIGKTRLKILIIAVRRAKSMPFSGPARGIEI